MDFAALTPTTTEASTLGALFGPLGMIAVVATLLTLAVVIVGLIVERRENASIRRLAAPRRPFVVAPAGRRAA